MRKRGFEIVKAYEGKGIVLPVRKTGASAGYDIEAAETTILPPQKITVVATGIKAYMQNDEYFGVHIRSGLSIKQGLSLINGQGIIDADYYDNPENEGHIMLAIINHGNAAVAVEKGMRLAQGVFYKYLTIDGDAAGQGQERQGGMGSTGV